MTPCSTFTRHWTAMNQQEGRREKTCSCLRSPTFRKMPSLQVLKRVPTLKKLDGQPVDVEEREAVSK